MCAQQATASGAADVEELRSRCDATAAAAAAAEEHVRGLRQAAAAARQVVVTAQAALKQRQRRATASQSAARRLQAACADADRALQVRLAAPVDWRCFLVSPWRCVSWVRMELCRLCHCF